MTTDRELMQQALDALKWAADGIDTEMTQPYETNDDCTCPICKTTDALRARLAQPEPYKQPEDNRLLMQAYRAIHNKQPEPVDDGFCQACEGGYCTAKTGCVALSNPQPEPVAYSDIVSDGGFDPRNKFDAAPPQREWQGLTDEEIMAMRHMRDWTAGWTDIRYAREIEAKLREKNT